MKEGLTRQARFKQLLKDILVSACSLTGAGSELSVLLVHGHVRSGSTLLHHILASSPGIAGCGERNRQYRDSRDLLRLAVDVHSHLRILPGRHLVYLDQVNHDMVATEIMDDQRIRHVFLVRQPTRCLQSIARTFPWFDSARMAEAAEYYARRLDRFEELAIRIDDPSRQFFLTYEQLLHHNTNGVLVALNRFLELGGQLQPTYDLFRFSGKRGDQSSHIYSRRIIDTSDGNEPVPDISRSQERKLRDKHRHCLRVLEDRCTTARCIQ